MAGVFQNGADAVRGGGVGVVDDGVHSGLRESRGPSGANYAGAQAGDGFACCAHCGFATPIFVRASAGVMMLNPARDKMFAAFSVSCALFARTPFLR